MKTRISPLFLFFALLLLASLACNLANLGSPTLSPTQIPTEIPAQPETEPATQEPSPTTAEVVLPTDTAAPPTATAEPEPDFTYEDISFSYDPSLASGVTTSITPKWDNPDEPAWMKSPELINFTLENFPVTDRYPNPVISVFSVDEYLALDPASGEVINHLQTLLAARPADPEPPMPYLLVTNAAQVIAVRIGYLDFKNGSGIVYLTQYAQDVSAINNQALFYTFKGITSDGKWYVSAAFPVTHPQLPPDSNVENYDAMANAYPQYLAEMKTFLESQPSESFNPNLDLLDEVFRSLKVK